MNRFTRLIHELQRRRVYRVAVAYAAVAFVIWQAADFALPALRLPDWVPTLVVVLTLVGFPVALILAWVFDITPEGVRRTEPLAPGREAPAPRRPAVLAAASAVLVLVIAGGWLLLRATLAPRDDYYVEDPRLSMAILPFTVTADTDALDYLGEAAVNMLGINVGSWREVRVADRRQIEGYARDRGVTLEGHVALDDALAIARDAHVGTLVLGEIVGHAGIVRIIVHLYDVASREVVEGPEQVEGSTADVFPLFDRLTARILDVSGAEAMTPDLASATTNSLQAYREYAEGLRHLYRWELEKAAERFRAAISEDSTFALAYHKLALALEWQPQWHGEEEKELSAKAVQYADRLPWRERQHVRAWHALEEREFNLARELFGELIAADSTDAEAWFGLGDVEYRDRSLIEGPEGQVRPRANWNVALQSFERAVSLMPEFHLGWGHAFEIYEAATESGGPWFGSERTVGSTVQREEAFVLAWEDSLLWLPIDGFDWSGSYRSDSVISVIQDSTLSLAKRWSLAAPDLARPREVLVERYLERESYRLALAEELELLRIRGDTTTDDRLFLGTLYLIHGRYDEASTFTAEFEAAFADTIGDSDHRMPTAATALFIARGQPGRALALYAPLWRPRDRNDPRPFDAEQALVTINILGSAGADRPELDAAFDTMTVLYSEPGYTPNGNVDIDTRRVEPGLLLLEPDEIRHWYARLDSLPEEWRAPEGCRIDSIPDSWRAYLQLRVDSLDQAAHTLDGVAARIREYKDRRLPSFTLYLMGNVAQQLGRDSLALELFVELDSAAYSLGIGSPPYTPGSVLWPPGHLALLSLSYLHRARSYEALGNVDNAIDYYERFVTVWGNAEPDLQHHNDEARRALARLRGEASEGT